MERHIYLCEDNAEGIFSAIYKAYEDRHGHLNNEIRIEGNDFNRELFCEYHRVETDYDRAVKVARTICREISEAAYDFVHRAACSWQSEKADAIYHFIQEGLRVGERAMNHLTAPHMQTLYAIDRNITNEIHAFKEFLRFEELENGVLFGRINPKSAVLPYLADHFEDRFSGEKWVIADTVHRTVLIHGVNRHTIYAAMTEADLEELMLHYSAEEKEWQKLWKVFVDAIAIKERVNRNLQRQMLPLHFRKFMKEFSDR